MSLIVLPKVPGKKAEVGPPSREQHFQQFGVYSNSATCSCVVIVVVVVVVIVVRTHGRKYNNPEQRLELVQGSFHCSKEQHFLDDNLVLPREIFHGFSSLLQWWTTYTTLY